MPTALRNLDDRVLGRRGTRHADSSGHGDVYPDEHGADEQGPGERGAHVTRVEPTPTTEPTGSARDGALKALGVVWVVLRVVLLLLALVVVLGIVFTLAPTNEDNVIVRNALSLAETVAGPFRDVFTADDADRELLYNYGLATAVYLVAATLVGKLPGSSKV